MPACWQHAPPPSRPCSDVSSLSPSPGNQDYDKAFANLAATEAGKEDGDEYTLDDMFVDRAAKAVPRGKVESKDRQRAINGASRRRTCLGVVGAGRRWPGTFDVF